MATPRNPELDEAEQENATALADGEAELASLRADEAATREAETSRQLAEMRAELDKLREDKARRDRADAAPQRGDADGVSPPLEPGQERENTHILYLANGETVEAAGAGATHVGTEHGTFAVVLATPLGR